MRASARSFARSISGALLAIAGLVSAATASDFSQPWLRPDRALVIDAYEYNEIDWQKLATDERIAGFIGKGSDGLPPAYHCSGDETETALCSALWKRYSVAKELFHTRKAMAKSLGLEWGAYHLGRPGNPIDQANHFIDFAQPGPDDLVALDIEDNDPEQWMSLEDAEEFARHIKRRIGRYPVLYTNGSTAKYIAAHRDDYPLLSRLPLWYARYKPEIGEHFPKGHWQDYVLWQFVSQINCDERSCPYRPPGTNHDIDVNVASVSAEELRDAWPFGELVEPVEPLEPAEPLVASVPVPTPRAVALGGGDVTLTYAAVATPPKSVDVFAKVFAEAGADQEKLAPEPDAVVQAESGADELSGKLQLASLPARAASYVRLSALKAYWAQASASSPDGHLGVAEYLAWRKDNGGAAATAPDEQGGAAATPKAADAAAEDKADALDGETPADAATPEASDKEARLTVELPAEREDDAPATAVEPRPAEGETPLEAAADAASAKLGRIAAEASAERMGGAAEPADDAKPAEGGTPADPATTGSVAIPVSGGVRADGPIASAQDYPRETGWIGTLKAYLGLF